MAGSEVRPEKPQLGVEVSVPAGPRRRTPCSSVKKEADIVGKVAKGQGLVFEGDTPSVVRLAPRPLPRTGTPQVPEYAGIERVRKKKTVQKFVNESRGNRISLAVHVAPLADGMPEISDAHIADINRTLMERGSQLRCRQFIDLSDPLAFDDERIAAHIQPLARKEREAVERLHQERQLITYFELQRGLAGCEEVLGKLLGDQDYAVAYKPKKSNQWITESALSLMGRAPDRDFPIEQTYHGVDLMGNIVLFDDAAYAGTQMRTALELLIKRIQSRARANIYIVVPFTSTIARQKLESSLKTAARQASDLHINVHLITSTLPVKTLEEAFRGSEDLIECLPGFGRPTNCVAATEWCIPDGILVPVDLVGDEQSPLMRGRDRQYKELYRP